MHPMSQPVCLITGAGDGTGAAIARRFTAGGYRVALLARTGDRLRRLESELAGSRGYVCDVGNLDHLKAAIANATSDLGPPRVAVHNAVMGVQAAARSRSRPFRENVSGQRYGSYGDGAVRRS